MKGDERKRRLSPAMIISLIALAIALTGTAYAALSKNSVGSRQLKSGAVTTSRLADEAVNGSKVASHTLTGKDINSRRLGTVPSATNAQSAGTANSLSGHSASCPQRTTLIRGVCFDTSSSGPVTGVKAAADACAARGGNLPSVEQLVSSRNVLNLGDGNGVHSQFTDSYYADYQTQNEFSTTVVSEAGPPETVLTEDPKTHKPLGTYEYICVYPLVR